MLASLCPWFRAWMLLLFFAAINGSSGLTNMSIVVPEAMVAGEDVMLVCNYELEGAALYTIKWYWDEQEFYRFVPKESPPSKIFPLDGFNVDQSLSDAKQVTLRKVHRDLTGYYKCEVSADAPSFHTEIRSASMIVAELPEVHPILTTEKLKYSLGERIRANCTSSAAYPATNISWVLNGQTVSTMSSPHTKVVVTLTSDHDERESTRSFLELEATSTAFREGKLRLRCVETVFNLHRRTDEVDIAEDTPQLAPVMGPTAPHSHDSATNLQVSSLVHPVLLCWISLLLLAYNSR